MKRITSIALICLLILASVLLTACTRGDSSQGTTTGPDSGTTTGMPAGPVPLASVNGMNARQLLEKFADEFAQANIFDLSMTMSSTESGVTTTEHVNMKLSQTEMHLDMLADGQAMKLWFVDNMLYLDTDGYKIKASDVRPADILGDDFIDSFLAKISFDFDEDFLEKLDAAQLYSDGGEYYFTLTFTDAEAEQKEPGSKGYTNIFYFDSTGTLKKAVSERADATTTMIIGSYGKPISITAPADANTYIDAGSGNQDAQAYAVYEQLCDTLESATIYAMYVNIDKAPYLLYETDGQGQYAGVHQDGSFYEVWKVGNWGYVAVDEQTPVKTPLTYDMIQSLESAKSLKSLLYADQVDQNAMTDLTLSQASGDQRILSFEVEHSVGASEHYTFTFDEQMSSIHIEMISIAYGQQESVDFWFSRINDASFEVTAPVQ